MTQLSDGERTKMRARQMGFVFQSFNLVPTLTAVEKCALAAEYAGVPGRTARAKANEALAAVGLADRADHRPMELSGGEQQRVAILALAGQITEAADGRRATGKPGHQAKHRGARHAASTES
jgi:predicted ABC-type transport system involved in lysophospholipase L1 biosynthesis ATPase subunit